MGRTDHSKLSDHSSLIRCIVGTCTYQLKGPHTSTLACHLKKHAAEYAEFQRLKVCGSEGCARIVPDWAQLIQAEYTRDRVVTGQQTGGSGELGSRIESSHSSCSTPSRSADQSSDPRLLLSPFQEYAVKTNNNSSCTPSPGPGGFLQGENCVARQPPQPEQPPQLHLRNQFPPPPGGIFGPHHLHPHLPHPLGLSAHSPPFHHFMMAAMAAANGQVPTPAMCPPFPVPVLAPADMPDLDAIPASELQKHAPKQQCQGIEKRGKSPAGCGGGTGANLL